MDKYQFMVEVAKVYDERDHLREENDMLEKLLAEFKRSDSGGELTPLVAKVYEYGVSRLMDKCFTVDFYSIGVCESDDGELYPNRDLNEWVHGVSTRRIPEQFSYADVVDICWLKLSEIYDAKWNEEVADYRESHPKEA